MIRTLFTPIDLSATSDNAIQCAVGVARKFGSKLYLFHAMGLPYAAYSAGTVGGVPYYDPMEEAEVVENRIDRLIKDIPGLNDIDYELITLPGVTPDLIKDQVEDKKADLVIIGTTGASGILELFGTVAEKVTREAQCPVLVIPNEYTYKPFDKISLALTEENIDSDIEPEILVQFVKKFETVLEVVTIRKEKEEAREKHPAIFLRLKDELGDLIGFDSFRTVVADDEEEGMIEYLHQQKVDLLALVYREHGYFERLLDPGLRKKLVFHSDIPLLVLK